MFGYTKSVLSIHLVVFVFVWLSLNCSFAFQPFKLIRQRQDIFENPTVTICDHNGDGYCKIKTARCTWGDYGSKGCCYCLCGYSFSTFDISTLKCQANSYFRKGCNLRFVNVYSGDPIKVLDLSRNGNGKDKVALPYGRNDKVKCKLNSVHMFLRDGRMFQVKEKLLALGKVSKDRHVEIKWKKVNQIKYHGNIFKVNIICDVEIKSWGTKSSRMKKSECFVFKSSGTFTVSPLPPASSSRVMQTLSPTTLFPPVEPLTSFQPVEPLTSFQPVEPLTSFPPLEPTSSFPPELPTLFPPLLPSTLFPPLLPSTSFQPVEPGSVEATPVVSSPIILMTTMGLETETFPGVARSSVPVTPITMATTTKGFELHGKMTTKEQAIMPSSTSYIAETSSKYYVDPNARKGSGGGDKIAVISSAVVVCVLVILAICLFLLWSRKRNGKTSAQKQNHTDVCNAGMTADDNNAMGMNHLENIYAEADVAVSSNCVGEKGNGHVYEYADNTIDNNYTTLDKTIHEENNHYQPLQTDNAYVRIPKKGSSQSEVRASGQPSVTTGPGNKHDERVYSVLEDENNPERATLPVSEAIYHVLDDLAPPETSSRATDSRPGNKLDELVYSVVEDESKITETTSPVSEPIYYEPDHTAIDGDISGRVRHLSPGNENNERVYSVLEETGNESAVTMPESDYVTVLPELSHYEKPIDVSNA